MTLLTQLSLFLSALIFLATFSTSAFSSPKHGIAMHGDLKYSAGFTHFDYVNPNAPKGGHLRLAVVGDSFDSFNPFSIKGVAASGTSYLYQSLTAHAEDEAFSEYGLIARSIERSEDGLSVTYQMRPEAKFSDGSPLTARDVVFSYNLLTDHDLARPFYKAYYQDIERVDIIDDHTVRFHFKTDQNKELALIIGQIPILSERYWSGERFSNAGLDFPVGNGPYVVTAVDPGRSVTYERNSNYWAMDLPVNKGLYNFDRITYEYYKDDTVALEAFKAGEYDYRVERTAKNWASAYTGEKFDTGLLKKEAIPHQRPAGMQAFVMNTRRELFKDIKTREAIGLAFDFEWTNKALFFSQYERANSFFANSELASTAMPSELEKQILKPVKSQVPEAVFKHIYSAPKSTKPDSIRANLRKASALLEDAGWGLKDKKRVHSKSGKALEFEFLLINKAFERVILPYAKNLERLGIVVNLRLVDTSQYINRLREFDFDMVVSGFGQSDSPGNEQREYWHSSRAQLAGSRNLIGIDDPAIDYLIEQVIQAPNRESLVAATRALDRVLLWNHFVVPNWFNNVDRVAYHSKLKRPQVDTKNGVQIDAWWIRPSP